MTLVTVIQARMGSQRLPGKVLMEVGKKTILEHVLGRLEMCERDVGRVVVATSAHGGDNVIEDLCRDRAVDCYRSSEHDVLHRYQQAAAYYEATMVLRVTADEPLLCPELTAAVLGVNADYVTFQDVPLGLTPELISSEALYRCWKESFEYADREHVTLYALKHPNDFRLEFLRPDDWLFDKHSWRLTVDTREDIELLERLYELSDGELFGLGTREIVALVDQDNQALELATRRA